MTRLSSTQPKRALTRTQSDLSPFRRLIARKYIDQGWRLEDIMAYIQKEYGVAATEKQYKTLLKAWGLRRRLTLRDAAFILRLLNEARRRGLDEVVLFSSVPRRRVDVLRYIARKDGVSDEASLLSHISDRERTPAYIALPEPGDVGQHPPSPPLLPTPPLADSPKGLVAVGVDGDCSAMATGLPSLASSPLSLPGSWSTSDRGSRDSISSLVSHTRDMYLPEPGSRLPYSPHRAQPAVQAIVRPFLSVTYAPDPSSRPSTSATRSVDLTNAACSATPPSYPDLDCLNLNVDIHRFGDNSGSEQLNDGSLSGNFVQECLYWLICLGQDNEQSRTEAELHLDDAMRCFEHMLQDEHAPGEACLSALGVAVVLFGSYGHTNTLETLLDRCDAEARKARGSNDPLRMTIAFKKKVLPVHGGRRGAHNIDRLAEIRSQMTERFLPSSGPVLMARYNLAWAVLENEAIREDKDCRAVREELEELTALCDAHLGYGRIETIMAAATWARATFHYGDFAAAEAIISDHVCPRIRKNFPDNHPYHWEAKHRHAFFLFELARSADPAMRGTRLQYAEQLLREVVRDRRRVLGASNVKSKQSYRLLRDVLKQQGKVDEAQDLDLWCKRELSQYLNFARTESG